MTLARGWAWELIHQPVFNANCLECGLSGNGSSIFPGGAGVNADLSQERFRRAKLSPHSNYSNGNELKTVYFFGSFKGNLGKFLDRPS
jgi:hypothetical protein